MRSSICGVETKHLFHVTSGWNIFLYAASEWKLLHGLCGCEVLLHETVISNVTLGCEILLPAM